MCCAAVAPGGMGKTTNTHPAAKLQYGLREILNLASRVLSARDPNGRTPRPLSATKHFLLYSSRILSNFRCTTAQKVQVDVQCCYSQHTIPQTMQQDTNDGVNKQLVTTITSSQLEQMLARVSCWCCCTPASQQQRRKSTKRG